LRLVFAAPTLSFVVVLEAGMGLSLIELGETKKHRILLLLLKNWRQ
jgi:hypothetical protein